jgi:hypothetical protein
MEDSCSMHREMRNVYRILVGKPEGKRPRGRHRRRWDDSIRTNIEGIDYEGVDWIHLAQGKDQWRSLVDTEMNVRVP